MKRKVFAVGLAAMALLCACGKEHQCKCVTTDVPDDGLLKIMTVDAGLGCDDIHTMGFEVHITDSTTGAHTLTRQEMHEVSCRDYAE